MLNKALFISLAQVRAVLHAWKDDYNHARVLSALDNLTPTEFAACSAPGPQRGGALRYTMGLRVPPRCSTEPCGLKCTWDSPHCRMSRGAQTITCAAPFPP